MYTYMYHVNIQATALAICLGWGLLQFNVRHVRNFFSADPGQTKTGTMDPASDLAAAPGTDETSGADGARHASMAGRAAGPAAQLWLQGARGNGAKGAPGDKGTPHDASNSPLPDQQITSQVCVRARLLACVCTYAHTHTRTHTHTSTLTHTHARTHTHKQAHTHTCTHKDKSKDKDKHTQERKDGHTRTDEEQAKAYDRARQETLELTRLKNDFLARSSVTYILAYSSNKSTDTHAYMDARAHTHAYTDSRRHINKKQTGAHQPPRAGQDRHHAQGEAAGGRWGRKVGGCSSLSSTLAL